MVENSFIEEDGVRIFKDENVFYNPAQKLSRDITIIAFKAYFEENKFNCFLAMEATGLRGIRFAKEIPNIIPIFNDRDVNAIKAISKNLELNEISYSLGPLPLNIENPVILNSDCNKIMREKTKYFDSIDIDPFGSCSNFIESSINAVKNNGLVFFTSTDKQDLVVRVKNCFLKYDVILKQQFSIGEMPLRILLSYISRVASKQGCSIEPMVSLSVDYYVRVGVKVIKKNAISSFKNNCYCYICDTCHFRTSVPYNSKNNNSTCHICNKPMKMYGPFWCGEIQNREFIKKMIDVLGENYENKRLLGILKSMEQEINTMFTYDWSFMRKYTKSNNVKLRTVLNALANENYEILLSHCEIDAFKTNAPVFVIYEILREANNDKEAKKYFYEENPKVEKIFSQSYYRKLLFSKIGPGSRPTNKKSID